MYTDSCVLPEENQRTLTWELCIRSKSTHKVPKPLFAHASGLMELIHSDLNGKINASFRGSQYYITFVDEFTPMAWIYFLERKSDASTAIKDFIVLSN